MTRYEIRLEKIPGQRLSTALNEHDVEIELCTFRCITFMSVWIDGLSIVSSVRCVPKSSILPMWANRIIGGTLSFETISDEYPYYEKFGTDDCRLIYEAQ